MRIQRRLSIVLFVSLAINLILIGMLATFWLKGDLARKHARWHRFDRDAAMAAISEDSRRAVEEVWQQHRGALREHWKERRAMRQQMREMLLSDQFDKAAYITLNEKMNAQSLRARARLHNAIAETAARLPAAERRRYFEEGYKRRKRGRRKKTD